MKAWCVFLGILAFVLGVGYFVGWSQDVKNDTKLSEAEALHQIRIFKGFGIFFWACAAGIAFILLFWERL